MEKHGISHSYLSSTRVTAGISLFSLTLRLRWKFDLKIKKTKKHVITFRTGDMVVASVFSPVFFPVYLTMRFVTYRYHVFQTSVPLCLWKCRVASAGNRAPFAGNLQKVSLRPWRPKKCTKSFSSFLRSEMQSKEPRTMIQIPNIMLHR